MKKAIVFAFGRFNPPTSGHQLLIDKIVALSKEYDADPIVFPSRSEDKKKNPLPFDIKLKYLKKFFPEVIFIDDPSIKTPIDAFRWIWLKGYKEVYFVAGSDRLERYKEIAERNKTRFDVVEVISSGDRDPDSDDEKGISGSKMRGFVKIGDYASFKKGMPKKATEKDILDIYSILQDILNEELEEIIDNFLGEFLYEKHCSLSSKLVS